MVIFPVCKKVYALKRPLVWRCWFALFLSARRRPYSVAENFRAGA
jgi:hypothetical protein